MYQLFFYVPKSHLETVKNAIFGAGAGRLGNYSHCSWETEGIGQFMPLPGSNPYVGKENFLEKIPEYKVETICSENCLNAVIQALLAAHPYETPAYGINVGARHSIFPFD
ncbi:MAG: NGG1p interacting factor NIF3 [Gammaproteobacteria bacterium]